MVKQLFKCFKKTNNIINFIGHVHAGNVFIIDGIAHLCDIENFVLGCSSFYRPFFVQHSRINSVEAIDVYSFGHLLYEMTRSYSLQDSYSRTIIDCPDSLSKTPSTYHYLIM